ncbi:MAG TPA: TVP38/TMEM64 family protein [Dissulfurispiraceae bacterium]|nr:TVP38/TMEM64 family protein [Dissulfurispiraceae bacterium]
MVPAVKIAAIIAIAVACIMSYPHLTPQNISTFVGDNSVSAPLLFIIVCAVRPVLFFLPSMGLTIVAGVLFGTLWGTIYVAIGGVFSTAVGYYFARWMGRGVVQRLVAGNAMLSELEKEAHEHSRSAVLSMRLFNLPWDVVSYWAGLQGIRFWDFYIASMVPLVPISFLYTYFGSKVFNPYSAGFIISLAVMFIMGAVPYIRARLKRRVHE